MTTQALRVTKAGSGSSDQYPTRQKNGSNPGRKAYKKTISVSSESTRERLRDAKSSPPDKKIRDHRGKQHIRGADDASKMAAGLKLTRRPLDMTSRQEQRAENELRRKRLHLERLLKLKGWQKGQQQQHSKEIDKVREEIESLHDKLSSAERLQTEPNQE